MSIVTISRRVNLIITKMDNVPNNFYRASVKALILNDKNEFLLIQEENGLWELPGGGLDFGESAETCIKRELKEEMGLEVTWVDTQPSYFATGLNSTGVWRIIVLFETRVKDLDFVPTDECVDMRFFTTEKALKEQLYPDVKEFVNAFKGEVDKTSTKK